MGPMRVTALIEEPEVIRRMRMAEFMSATRHRARRGGAPGCGTEPLD
jgi:hypothetical protein